MSFTAVDWIIVAGYVAICFFAGIWCRKFVGDVSDFLVAGRELGLHLGVATLAATEIGTVTFMYYAELGYKSGFAPFITALLAGGVMAVLGRTGFVVERMRDLKLLTVPEYCQARYSRGVRVLVGILVATGGILNMGVFLRIEGEFLTILTGIPSRFLIHVMVAILLLEMAYTILGGMVSIVVTDFIQYVMLSIATIVISVLVVQKVGWPHIVDTVRIQMGARGFSPIANPDYGWTFIMWQILAMFAGLTCWQTAAMRTLSMRNKDLSRRVFTWSSFIFVGRGMLPMLWGVAALAAFGPGLVPIRAMPTLLHAILGPGVRGIVLAGMIAATMSVNSAYLLAWSSIISQDVIQPALNRPLGQKTQILINRISNVCVSVFVMGWSLFYLPPGATYLYLTITGTMFLAGTFVCVFLGMYWKRASTAGAYAAMMGGVGGSLGYLVLGLPANYSGFASFGMAGAGMLMGSLAAGRRLAPRDEAKQV